MKRIMAIAVVVVLALTFGISAINAQQGETGKSGCPMMSKAECPGMAKAGCPGMAGAEGKKCKMGDDGKCPMAEGKCPMHSHHGDKTQPVPEKGA